jgi:hypothetical protein
MTVCPGALLRQWLAISQAHSMTRCAGLLLLGIDGQHRIIVPHSVGPLFQECVEKFPQSGAGERRHAISYATNNANLIETLTCYRGRA